MRVMRSPASMEVAITGKCNLRCLYCFHFTSALDVPQDLPAEEWLTFFEELGRLAVLRVTLEGGEPFIRPDLPEIIEGIVKNRMRFNILSNGTLITEELAAFLAGTRRCEGVQISLDGSKPETHDACRGTGNFGKALKGLENLKRHDVPVQVRVTINRNNLEDLPEVARFLLDDLGLPSFSTNSADYMGICRSQAKKIQLTAADRSRAMELLCDLEEKYPRRISATAGPLAEARDWERIIRDRREGREPESGRGHLVSCGGTFQKLGVRCDGAIVPCILMSHIELGRINRDDLGEIWQHHPEISRIRQRSLIPLSDFPYCRDCEYLTYCAGGCPAVAYTRTGKDDHPNPDSCLRRFLEEGGHLPHVPPRMAVDNVVGNRPEQQRPGCQLASPAAEFGQV
jgi:SynChlorMet cassette radical SAM/SPASM protein ScmE